MKITLCILTLNELNGCMNDIPQLQREKFDEIFAIDGNSTDGTVEYLETSGIKVYQQPKKSLNAACSYAFKICKTDALIFFHPKGSVPVSDTLKFRDYLEEGYDLVIASRNTIGAINEEDNQLIKPRKWFVSGISYLAAFLFRREGTIVTDVLHGFRAMTVNAFNIVSPSDQGVTIDLEMVCRSYKNRLKIKEFPTKESIRISGSTHFKAFPTGWYLLKYLWIELFFQD